MFRSVLILSIISCVLGVVEKPQPYVVGGNNAALRQFPHVVSIRRTGNPNNVAGGSLVSAIWVLTSASATLNFLRPGDMTIVLGVINVENLAVQAPGFTAVAQEFRRHHEFRPETPINANIALVRIGAVACNAARFGVVNPIFIEPRPQPDDVIGVVAGWGSTWTSGTILRFAIVEEETCLTPSPVTFCFESAACGADIGAPLTTGTGLIGIVVTGNCGTGLDTYLRISVYRDWITGITGM